MFTDQSIRTKQSLLASTKYCKSPLKFISFAETFASMLRSMQIILCNTATTTEHIYYLFFPILYSRQASFNLGARL